MTGKPRRSAAACRLVASFALTLAGVLAPVSSPAAEDFFQMTPPFALPPPLFGGETRVPAARPTVFNPAHAHYVAGHSPNRAPEGRLRLRSVAFGGM